MEIFSFIGDYALEQSKTVSRGFTFNPSWRDAYFKKVEELGLPIDRKAFDAAQRYTDTQLEIAISRLAEGDSTAARRNLKNDTQLQKALAMIGRAQSQQDLFAIATAMAPAKPKH